MSQPLRPLQVPRGMTRDQTWAFTVRGWLLIALAMA